MNDPTADELASAYLDGEDTADERARVEGDPALLARVEELRSVGAFLRHRTVDTAPSGQRDAAVRAALAAMPVVDLRAARARRGLRIASIAAAVIAVVGAIGLLLSSISTRDDSAKSTAAAGAGAPAGATTTFAPLAEQAPSAGAASASGPGYLGAFADEDALAASVRSVRFQQRNAGGAAGAAADSAAQPGTRCAPSTPPGLTNVLTGTATLDGRAVQVDVYADTSGAQTLVVTDSATCTPVFSRPL